MTTDFYGKPIEISRVAERLATLMTEACLQVAFAGFTPKVAGEFAAIRGEYLTARAQHGAILDDCCDLEGFFYDVDLPLISEALASYPEQPWRAEGIIADRTRRLDR